MAPGGRGRSVCVNCRVARCADQRMRCGGDADLGDCSVLISMAVMLLAVGLLPLTRVVVCRPKTEAPFW